MQFQGLSASYGASSLPRDQFIIQAFASADTEEQHEADTEEERALRLQHQRRLREERKRRPSALSSYISEEGRLTPTTEEEDEEALLDDEEDDDDEPEGPAQHNTARSPGASLTVPQNTGSAYLLPQPPGLTAGGVARKQSTTSSGRLGSKTSGNSETTPLLAQRRASIATLTPGPIQRVFKGSSPSASRKETAILIWYTIPIFLTHLLEYSLLLATVISVGHLGTAQLAASSLGSMTMNVLALSIIQGLCAALDTLCSQAYASSNPKNTSLHALRTAFLTAVVLVPMSVLIYNGERLLLGLRQDPVVSKLAGQYLRVLLLGIPGYTGFEITRRWLQAQGLMIVPTISLLIASPINILLNWLLVWGPDRFRLGFLGAPLATAISFNIMFLFSVLYCVFLAPRDAWGGFSWAILRNLKPNITLGLAGYFAVSSDWISWEAVGLASAYIGTASLGANSVLGTSASLLYQLPYGLTVAAAVRTGNLVGAGLPLAAKTSSKVAWTISLAIGLINSSLLILLRKNWARLFSSDEEVINIVANVIPLVGLFQLFDAITGAGTGILRGAGLAALGAQMNIVAYWVIGLPLGFALTFSKLKWGLYGLWTGLSVALAFTAVVFTILVLRINWQDVVRKTKARLDAEGPSPSGFMAIAGH